MLELENMNEYMAAAEYMAKRNKTLKDVNDLPEALSVSVFIHIVDDVEAFNRAIRSTAYMLSQEGYYTKGSYLNQNTRL